MDDSEIEDIERIITSFHRNVTEYQNLRSDKIKKPEKMKSFKDSSPYQYRPLYAAQVLPA
jgi:hypothetical protein